MAATKDSTSSVFQGNFASGEMSPLLFSRVDLARFQSSVKTCRNFITQPHGGVKNRPGTQYIATTKYPESKARLIPFRFNSDQAYIIEAGDHYMRFFRNGVALTAGVSQPWVSGVDYAVGDRVSRNGLNYVCIIAHTSAYMTGVGLFTVT